MLTNLKFTLRRILRNKPGAIINILGLTIGIFISIILINYIIQESTYDHFHRKADRIYKVVSKVTFSEENTGTFGITFGSLADQYRKKFPQVENTARLYGPFTVEVDLEKKRFNKSQILYLDYSFFELFDFPQVSAQAFNSPNSAIVSKEFAQKITNGNPIGKQIEIGENTFTINAVVDIPYNTTFRFDVVLPVVSDPYYKELKDGGLEYETYVLLNGNSNNASTQVLLKDYYDEVMKEKWPLYESDNFLISLKDVYLNSLGVQNRLGNGNKQVLDIILTIALLVLVLALINYVNLQIANNHNRTQELRLKKIMGAGKKILVKQSVLESLLIICFSGLTAILLLDMFYSSAMSHLLGDEILTTRDWGLQFWSIFVLSLLLVGCVAGLIPSVKLFSIKSITQQELKERKLGKFTVSLLIFQFFISTSLLTAILFVNFQMDLLRNQSPGYNSEQVVVINNLNDNHMKKYQIIKTKLEKEATIVKVAGAQNAPGNGASGQFVHRKSKSPDDGISIAHIRTINGYAETLDIEFILGGDFTITTPGGETQFILNESAASELFTDIEDPIGEVIQMGNRAGKIVGVVKDFHYRSFHHQISPLAINVEEPYKLTMMIKVEPNNLRISLEKIEAALTEADPHYIFDYQFLDDRFDQFYQSELQAKTIITYATLIAFSISIMGLLALSIFVINSKIKEIAIRKALGGGNVHIFIKLSFQLISWIMIGNVLSIPASYFIAQSWVRDFVYQASLNNLLWMGPMSTMVTLLVAMSAITRKLYKTMTLNPIIYLRHE